jgi:thioredoxin 1
MIKIVKHADELVMEAGLTLIDFYADWCGPCKMMMPLLEELDAMYPDITILKVDADQFPEIMLKHGISNVPTLDIYEAGKRKSRKVGYVPKELLLKELETHTTFKRKI